MTQENKNELQVGNVTDLTPLFERAFLSVRPEVSDSPYVQEAIRVLPVHGYRSAIGCFWNAVVDDLRNKIMHRSLALFNKSAGVGREVKSYEDFQNFVNDDQLIEGAYSIGVIGWEASKILKHAKETRHIFDGHPKSTEPSIIKVLAMFDDCIRYVLNVPYPTPIVDLDDYVATMGTTNFDRNKTACANALTELPEVYKNELIHRLLAVYVHPDTSSTLRSNVEFVAPIVWPVLPKATKLAVVRRVDTYITQGDVNQTESAFGFVEKVGGNIYLSATAREYQVRPLVEELKANLDKWDVENRVVRELAPYAANVPVQLVSDYVCALTHTYVGYVGSSYRHARTDFYADGAALHIPKMFEVFDDAAAEAFVQCVRSSAKLRSRISSPSKLARLRSLANIVLEKVSAGFPELAFLEVLVDDARDEEFFKALGNTSTM